MITLKEFMEVVDYRITEGSDFCWDCYGPNAYRLDSWNGDQDGHSVSIVFDTKNQTVYEASVYDYRNSRAYRMINPDYAIDHKDEAASRNVDANEAWEGVNYVDLETEEDFLEKTSAIVNQEDYDTRVDIPITLEDDILFQLMKLAHEKDITLNQLFEEILREEIQRVQQSV